MRANADSFGAEIVGANLAAPLDEATARAIRDAWIAHRVVYFRDQPMDHHELERFTRTFGDWGDDPYVASIAGHEHIIEVRREPDERPTPFGASWHSDWSFQPRPPSATILHAKVVPPVGGETWYADGYGAFEALDGSTQAYLRSLTAIHSARRPYSHEGYAAGDGAARSMHILPSDDAWRVQEHPVVRVHPESGREALWVNRVYTIAIQGLEAAESDALIKELCAHATSEPFLYKHAWEADMLTMWDNRCVQHCARGGYDGYLRVMHRTTVAGEAPAWATSDTPVT